MNDLLPAPGSIGEILLLAFASAIAIIAFLSLPFCVFAWMETFFDFVKYCFGKLIRGVIIVACVGVLISMAVFGYTVAAGIWGIL